MTSQYTITEDSLRLLFGRQFGVVVGQQATLAHERVIAQLGGFFSVFALLLASLGLHGAAAGAPCGEGRSHGSTAVRLIV